MGDTDQMQEESAFARISDLFEAQVPEGAPEAGPSKKRKARGKDKAESKELARECLLAGDFEAAVQHSKTALAQGDGPDDETVVDLAAAYDFGDQAPQALRQYWKALRLNSSNLEAVLGAADVMNREGKTSAAFEAFRSAVAKEPGNPQPHFSLAEALRSRGHNKAAFAAIQGAIAAKPDDPFYHYWAGDLLIEMGLYEDALHALRAAMELSPGDDHIYVRAAVAFWRCGRRTEAIKAVRLAGDLDPAKQLYYGILHAMLAQAGQHDEAALEQTKALKLDRYDREALTRLKTEMALGVSDGGD